MNNNFQSQSIQNTYTYVLHHDTASVYNGTGSRVNYLDITSSYANSASYPVNASYTTTNVASSNLMVNNTFALSGSTANDQVNAGLQVLSQNVARNTLTNIGLTQGNYANASLIGVKASTEVLSGSAESAVGFAGQVIVRHTNSAVSHSVGVLSIPLINDLQSISASNAYGLYVKNTTLQAGSYLTNLYGVYIQDFTAGTNRYGIYQSGSNSKNYFGGPIVANTLSASSYVFTGTTTGSAAPVTLAGYISVTISGSAFWLPYYSSP